MSTIIASWQIISFSVVCFWMALKEWPDSRVLRRVVSRLPLKERTVSVAIGINTLLAVPVSVYQCCSEKNEVATNAKHHNHTTTGFSSVGTAFEEVNAGLDRLGAAAGDKAAREAYFELIRSVSRVLHSKTDPVGAYLETKATREKERKVEDAFNNEAFDLELVRIQPVYDFVTGRFDAWMDGIEAKQLLKLRNRKQDVVPLVKGRFARLRHEIRKVDFETGGEINLVVSQATIEQGKFNEEFSLRIVAYTGRRLPLGNIWSISISPSRKCIIQNYQPDLFKFSGYEKEGVDSPIEEQGFVDAVMASFDEVMTYCVDRITTDHKEFFDHLREEGYHIFSRDNARRGFYPKTFPIDPEFKYADMRQGDTIRVRAFFVDDRGTPLVDGTLINLEVKLIDEEAGVVRGDILTDLPAVFPIARDASLELTLDEILFLHPKDSP